MKYTGTLYMPPPYCPQCLTLGAAGPCLARPSAAALGGAAQARGQGKRAAGAAGASTSMSSPAVIDRLQQHRASTKGGQAGVGKAGEGLQGAMLSHDPGLGFGSP